MTVLLSHGDGICDKLKYRHLKERILIIFFPEFLSLLQQSTAHPYQYELEVFEPSKTQMKPHKEQVSSTWISGVISKF